jgi:hypothetical protein
MPLVAQLLVASAMVLATILFHLGAIAALLPLLQRGRSADQRSVRQDIFGIVVAATGLFALHGLEIWAYAALYFGCGALPDFETALYFSTSTYTTIGYGDVLLTRSWRLVGAIEGANGIILLGWSTAFFVAMVRRIRLVETELKSEQ